MQRQNGLCQIHASRRHSAALLRTNALAAIARHPARHRAGATDMWPFGGPALPRGYCCHGIIRSSSARRRHVRAAQRCPASSAMHASMQNWHQKALVIAMIRQNSTWCHCLAQERQASLQELPQSTRRRRSAVLTTRGACLYLPHQWLYMSHQIRNGYNCHTFPERSC